jgi:hypothetical protein
MPAWRVTDLVVAAANDSVVSSMAFPWRPDSEAQLASVLLGVLARAHISYQAL